MNDLTITRYMYPFEYPFPPDKVVDVFVEYYGPLKERPRKSGRRRSQETKEKIANSMLEVWKKKRATSGPSNTYADLETPDDKKDDPQTAAQRRASQ